MGLWEGVGGCEMTTETRTITVQAYRDEDGQPTCAGRTEEAGCCRFVGVTGAGSRPFCLSSIDSLLRRSGGSGSLIPAEGCPVWSGE